MSNPAFYPTNGTDGIDVGLLEKRLEGLRDTQESVQGLSLWCQSNKQHSGTIAETWLRVLRKSAVEKRLAMFYLANDVVQHARRKSDTVVLNQWAFAIQKATAHVRAPSSVSSAVTRIFKIWEERGVYSKESIADLLSLLNNISSKDKVESKNPETYTANAEKVSAFQSSALLEKFKIAGRLKTCSGTTFRTKSYCQMDIDTLKNSIKDRHHGQEVIQEMGALLEQLRTSEQKLQAEVDERRKIIETTEIAIVFYENVRSESEIVNSAYKSFTARIMKAKEAVDSKLKSFEGDEITERNINMEKEPSPCPSPPTAAPSPPEDDDDDEYTPFDTEPINLQPKVPVLPSCPSLDGSFNQQQQSIVISPTPDSIMSLQDVRTMAQTIPSAMNPSVVTTTSTALQNPPHLAYNNHQMPVIGSGFDPSSHHLAGIQQQLQMQSWPRPNNNENFASMMMNFQQNAMPLPGSVPPNFAMTPSMHIQMQMQHMQQRYGFPPPTAATNFDIPDVSSIPLPPPPSGGPPLPNSQQEIMFIKQFPPPPLPPKP